MRKSEYIKVKAEIATLQSLTARIPKEDVLDRLSIENRVAELVSQITNDPLDMRVPKMRQPLGRK